jgi:hypothetical protein
MSESACTRMLGGQTFTASWRRVYGQKGLETEMAEHS